jgi:hypothetical protein
MELNLYSLFETLGLGIFIYYLIKSLRIQISGLKGTIAAQNETLKVMDKRIEETEKIGDIYKSLIRDLPSDIENYKAIISKTKDATILELNNQYEITKKKLAEAEGKIEKSGNSDENVKLHLKILRNILSKKGNNHEYYIAKIIEICGITLEDSVSKIIESHTLEEFLVQLGLNIKITEDRSEFDNAFQTKKDKKGRPLYRAFITFSLNGWHAIINDNFYANADELNILKDEFYFIKKIN